MHKKIFLKKKLIMSLMALLVIPVFAFADAGKIFKDNSKSVVVVVTYNEKGEPISQGSGFIVRSDGAVVTNYHVISKAKDIKIKAGGKILDVEGLIYSDKENDLVILKAKGEKLPVVKLGDIAKANIGEKVYVISSPEGLENTISDGLLSGIRDVTSEKKVLQITAPISPGSSGGPVFNEDGEVIGIATFLIKEAQNLNFAMPVNLIKDRLAGKKITALKKTNIEDFKNTAEYWFVTGYYLESSGSYNEAIEGYKIAIMKKPDYFNAYFRLGYVYRKLSMGDEALKAIMQAINIKPDSNAYVVLATLYGDLEMKKEEISAYKNAINLKPDNAMIYVLLGIAYGQQGLYEEAIEYYKEAIRITPDFAEAHYELGVINLILNDKSSALEEYKILKKLDPGMADELFELIYN